MTAVKVVYVPRVIKRTDGNAVIVVVVQRLLGGCPIDEDGHPSAPKER
jgi:hypothetical protein